MGTNAQINWDDLRFVLAVAEEGSVSAASRSLGVNHATVLRRIAGFETRHGLKIFEKTATGYRVSSDRLALIEALRETNTAVGQVERMIEAVRPNLTSGLRITSTDAFCQFILAPILAALSHDMATPVSIMAGNAHLDFRRLQADITVRPAVRLPEELSGVQAATFRFGVYAADGSDDAWLGLEGPVARSPAGDWLRRTLDTAEATMSSDSFVMLAALAAEGRGRAVLPAFVGDAWPGLKRLQLLTELEPTPIWVASHVDLAASGRLKRARSFLAAGLAAQEPRMLGEARG